MRLHEYQAKQLLAAAGVQVPDGGVAASPEEAGRVAARLGGRAVVKAQVHAGGRGKAGGVKVVGSPEEAAEVASSLLGKRLVTAQTGEEGVAVNRVLVEETVEPARELYLSILVDGAVGAPVLVASDAGGVEIEEVAERSPERIVTARVDPAFGLYPYQGRGVAGRMGGVGGRGAGAFGVMAASLYRAFSRNDCSLVEINPLVLTADGTLLCVDAKVVLDDDALFRHGDLKGMRDEEQEDPLEVEASRHGIQYIRLDGNVGCMVNGAGLAMATMDAARSVGASPANFLDVGGGASEEKVARAFRLILGDSKVEAVLINIFGGILRCDVLARGLIQGAEGRKATPPLVVRMLGTNVEEGRRALEESSLRVDFAGTMEEAARRVREAAGGSRA